MMEKIRRAIMFLRFMLGFSWIASVWFLIMLTISLGSFVLNVRATPEVFFMAVIYLVAYLFSKHFTSFWQKEYKEMKLTIAP